MYCQNCNKEFDNNMRFCPYCGGVLTQKEVKHYCQSCGYELEGNFSFCPKCGTPIGSASAAQVVPEKKEEFAVGFYVGNSFFNKGSGVLTVGDEGLTFDWKIKNNALLSLPFGIYAAKKEHAIVFSYDSIVSLEQKGMSLSKFNSVDLTFTDGAKISFAFQFKKNATRCAELIRMHLQ